MPSFSTKEHKVMRRALARYKGDKRTKAFAGSAISVLEKGGTRLTPGQHAALKDISGGQKLTTAAMAMGDDGGGAIMLAKAIKDKISALAPAKKMGEETGTQVRVQRHLFNPFHSKSTGQFAPGHGSAPGAGATKVGGGGGGGGAGGTADAAHTVTLKQGTILHDNGGGRFGGAPPGKGESRKLIMLNKDAKLLNLDKPAGSARHGEIKKAAGSRHELDALKDAGFDGTNLTMPGGRSVITLHKSAYSKVKNDIPRITPDVT